MKNRRRDINIFSISSLDLFASAMGAFLLLTFVLIPFFPNLGDSEERIKKLLEDHKAEIEMLNAGNEKELEKLEQQEKQLQSDYEAKTKELEKKMSDIVFPSVDIVIALDTTGSMEEEIDDLKANIEPLIKVLLEASVDLSVGIVDFKHKSDKPAIQTFPLTKITKGNIAQMKNFIDGMEASGGGGREAVDLALEVAYSMRWRKEAEIAMIVIITDNPAEKTKIVYTYDIARKFAARGDNYQISTIESAATAEALEYLKILANEGKGTFIAHSSGFFAMNILLILANS